MLKLFKYKMSLYIKKIFKFFLSILIIFFLSFSTHADLTKNHKKLKFKESGPFYGIKENGRMIRGIYKLPKNETAQTDYYGLFTKNEMFWKGYSKHTYNDGTVVFQYNEYQLDDEGRVIQLDSNGKRVFKNGIFQLADSYVISEDNFEKVKNYIQYDIPIPFSFYVFDLDDKKDQNSEKNILTTTKDTSSNSEEIITLKKCYKINADKSASYDFIGKFDEDRNEVHKYVINKNLNTVTRVWVLTDEEIQKRKDNQDEVLKENVSTFDIVYIDDLIVKAKKKVLISPSDWLGEITINLKRNTVKTDFGSLNEKEFWVESQCARGHEKNLTAGKTFIDTDEKYFALVVGNNDYKFIENLDAAENDAVVIADVLEKKYGFEVDLLLNADYDTTVNSLFNITRKLEKDDNLLIYYAGHGEIDKAENRGYWLPIDASYEMRSKWISNQRIVDRIKATKAKHVLLIADSCFSGTLMRSGSLSNEKENIDKKYIDRLKNKKTRLVITSGGNEPVVDSVGGDHSLFALKLIDTLKNNNTVINSQILFENIRKYVIANADQTPERAMVHKTGHDGGDFLFFPKID